MDRELMRKYTEYMAATKNPNLTEANERMLVNLCTMAVKTAFKVATTPEDIAQAMQMSAETKEYIESFCLKYTKGTIWALEAYAQKKHTSFDIVENYYELLLNEARNLSFDSYCLYLEKNRIIANRFYSPKRRCFNKLGLIQGLQDLIDDKLDILTISMPPGTGKASTMDSKVLTPTGFIKMRDVKIGTKVIAGNGAETIVIGVYPQGKQPIYKVRFNDGSFCEVSDNHIWHVQTRDDRKNGVYRDTTTLEMLQHLHVEQRNNYSVDYIPPFDFEQREIPINEYLMGIILVSPKEFIKGALVIRLRRKEIAERVNRLFGSEVLERVHKTGNRYYVRDMGVCDYIAALWITDPNFTEEKILDKLSYINNSYIYNTYAIRSGLFRGILDTIGRCTQYGIHLKFKDADLAESVRQLTYSLGGYAKLTTKKINGDYIHDLNIQLASTFENPFSVENKAARYSPRREKIQRFITNIDYVGDKECQCIYLADPCHLYVTDDYIITHNTTIEKYFHSAICGWFPTEPNLFFSHSGGITKMYYDGMFDILTNDVEYTWRTIFPDCSVTSTNATMEQININEYKPFANVQTTSIGAKSAGKVRCSKFLLVDDLIGRIAEALDPTVRDRIWQSYTTDARQRKIPDKDDKPCKELILGTRWSLDDPIGRLLRSPAYMNNPRVRSIAVSYKDADGNSNFDYDVGGFSIQFFEDIKATMDEVSFRCLYENDPVEREGVIYDSKELRRYHSMPLAPADATKEVVDTKTTGADFMAAPILKQYGTDYYLVDAIYDNDIHFDLQEAKLANKIMMNNVTKVKFESNQGGDRLAGNVKKLLDEVPYNTEIISAHTGGSKLSASGKQTRIIVHSDWIKRHVVFPSEEILKNNKELALFMNALTTYSITGDNRNDDAPDSMAMFAEMETKQTVRQNYAEAVHNPLWF